MGNDRSAYRHRSAKGLEIGGPEFRNSLLLLSVRPADPVKDRGQAGN
jgi:hypothetical protein